MLRMYGQDGYHCTAELMHDTASEVDRILRKLAFHDSVMTFYLYVCYAEHRQNKGKDRRAHFHRGMARFGIDTACVCYADRKINVTHDLREYDIGNIRDLDRLTCLSIGKADPFKSGRFDVRGREPIGKRIYLRYDIFLVIYLLQAFLDIGS